MLRLASRFRKFHRNRSIFRTDGDKARDRKAWSEAATHYRSHLLLTPQDGAIWIQLGHVLKEDGQWQDAIAAYEQAREFLPRDADLLLHLGHALLATGDVASGVERLRDSAAGGNMQAAHDLSRMGLTHTANGDTTPAPTTKQGATVMGKAQQKLLNALSKRSIGFQAIESSDIQLVDDGQLKTTSSDPWIIFDWHEDSRPTTAAALLTIEVAPLDPDQTPTAQIYADMGDGFSERYSTNFPLLGNNISILLLNPSDITKLRFDPDQGKNKITFPKLSVTPLHSMAEVEQLVRRHAQPEADLDRLFSLVGELYSVDGICPQHLSPVIELDKDITRIVDFSHDYAYWLSQNDIVSDEDYNMIEKMDKEFTIRPVFSFVMPTYNTPIKLLRECIDSLLAQTYGNFEICIADDNSSNHEVVELLEEYAQSDDRVKYVSRKHNGHISASSNSALDISTGDYVVLVDHDDLIPDYALFILAYYINKQPDVEILFSDEDKVTVDGHRVQPYFKSDFNKFLMYGHNMVSHLGVYRRDLIVRAGGFRLGLEGSQDYDLLLRCYELTSADKILHIPHILYHWRIIPGSTAMSADQKSYAVVAAQHAINGHFERQNIPLRSIDGFAPGCTAVRPSRLFDTSMSIIIPTRNGLDILQPCVESILDRDHDNVEIIIVDNGSDDPEALAYFDKLAKRDDVRILSDPGDFNFSRINNMAARAAGGDILCFLNNDTEVVSKDWINRARTFLSMDDVGMVGARLLFPDGTLQHFGIALGMGEHRVAGVPHLGMDASLPGYFGKARLLQEVSAVTAACMFLRKADFEAVGGFNEALRVAYNDIDLCLKIRATGKVILADPDITLIHKESRSRGSDKHGARARRLEEEANWMREHWANQLDHDPYYSPNLDLRRIDFGYSAKSRQPWPWNNHQSN
ncbi:glycosyltransferase [Sphingobium sp. LF-16]|uniref:glycosyltransferase n=1 Tax=Sphingobium sp. LF-16 TaxID=2185111 RepID=UPI000F0895E3|nr:glycosyltransferase [Sphingobium sp. LF-16]